MAFFVGERVPVVTGLKADKTGKAARVFLDGHYAFTLPASIVSEKNITAGMKLRDELLKQLEHAASQTACLSAAYRLLGYRPRTEKELKDRLGSKGFGTEVVDFIIQRLKKQKLIDDLDFACRWQENRAACKPRSSYLVRRELKEKGVPEPDIEIAVMSHDDFDNAIRAARPRAEKLSGLDYETFRNRLGMFLRRRGFGYSTIRKVIDILWQENNG